MRLHGFGLSISNMQLSLSMFGFPTRLLESKRCQGFATDSRVLRAPCRITGDETAESEKRIGKPPFSVLPSWLAWLTLT